MPPAAATTVAAWAAVLLGPGVAVATWWVGIPALTSMCGHWPGVRSLLRPGAGWGMRDLSPAALGGTSRRAVRGGAWAGIATSAGLLVLIGAGREHVSGWMKSERSGRGAGPGGRPCATQGRNFP